MSEKSDAREKPTLSVFFACVDALKSHLTRSHHFCTATHPAEASANLVFYDVDGRSLAEDKRLLKCLRIKQNVDSHTVQERNGCVTKF